MFGGKGLEPGERPEKQSGKGRDGQQRVLFRLSFNHPGLDFNSSQ